MTRANASLPLLYIAGPYRGPTSEAVALNISTAKHTAALACRKGWAPVTPHMNFAQMDHIAPALGDEFWLLASLSLLRRCSALVLLPGWRESVGTLDEIAEARHLGIPLFPSADDLVRAEEFLATRQKGTQA